MKQLILTKQAIPTSHFSYEPGNCTENKKFRFNPEKVINLAERLMSTNKNHCETNKSHHLSSSVIKKTTVKNFA